MVPETVDSASVCSRRFPRASSRNPGDCGTSRWHSPASLPGDNQTVNINLMPTTPIQQQPSCYTFTSYSYWHPLWKQSVLLYLSFVIELYQVLSYIFSFNMGPQVALHPITVNICILHQVAENLFIWK